MTRARIGRRSRLPWLLAAEGPAFACWLAFLSVQGSARLAEARARVEASGQALERAELGLQRLEGGPQLLRLLKGSVVLRRRELVSSLDPSTPSSQRFAAELLVELDELLDPCELGGLDPFLALEALGGPKRADRAHLTGELPSSELLRLGRALMMIARSELEHGDATLSVAWLGAAGCVPTLLDGLHWGSAHGLWLVLMEEWLDELLRWIPMLPSGLELEPLDAALAGLDARLRCGRALAGERVIGLELFAAARNGQDSVLELLSLQERWTWRFARSKDEAVFLEHIEKALARLERPSEVISVASAPAYLSSHLVADLEADVLRTLAVQARLEFARLGLLAHERGARAALDAAAPLKSPYGGDPIHASIDAEGRLGLSISDPRGVLPALEYPDPSADE